MVPSIGSKIKDLRTKCGICQEDFCCNILNQTILSKIENDKMLPSIPQLQHISDYLCVPINYFFDQSDSASISPKPSYGDASYLDKLYGQKRYNDILYLYEDGKFKDLEHINKYFYVGMAYYFNDLYNNSYKTLRKFVVDYKKTDEIQKGELVENYAVTLNKLNCIMLKNSSYHLAIKYLQKAKEELLKYNKIDSKIFHIIINNIASVYCKFNKFDETIKVLNEFLSLNSDNVFLSILPSIHLTSNIAYYKTGRYREALDHIKKAIWLFQYNGQKKDAGECYLNYINCLRFDSRLDEALSLICKLKAEYSYDRELINLFLIQEMIVLFNMEKYDDLLLLSKNIDIKELRKRGKMEFFFMMGHVEFLNNNYSAAYEYFTKCEKYMIGKMHYPDLSLLYNDMAVITSKKEYEDESLRYKELDGIFNIMLKKD